MTEAPNFRISRTCYDCALNKARLVPFEEEIKCERYKVPSQYIAQDWRCDDHLTIEEE